MGQRHLNCRATTTTPRTALILTTLLILHTHRLSASVRRPRLTKGRLLTVLLLLLLHHHHQVLTHHPLLAVPLIHLHTLALGPRLLLGLLEVTTKVTTKVLLTVLTVLQKALGPCKDIMRWILRLSRITLLITMVMSQSLNTCLRQQASITPGMKTKRRLSLR